MLKTGCLYVGGWGLGGDVGDLDRNDSKTGGLKNPVCRGNPISDPYMGEGCPLWGCSNTLRSNPPFPHDGCVRVIDVVSHHQAIM